IEIEKPALNGRPRDPRDLRNRSHPATACRLHFGSRKQPPATLVELRAERRPALPNRFAVHHDRALPHRQPEVNPHTPSHSVAANITPDSVIFESVLSLEKLPLGGTCRVQRAAPMPSAATWSIVRRIPFLDATRIALCCLPRPALKGPVG